MLLSIALVLKGRAPAAKKELNKALAKFRDPEEFSVLYSLLIKLKRWEEAEALAKRHESLEGKKTGKGRLQRVLILVASGKAQDADRLLEQALNAGIEPATALFWGQTLQKNRCWKQAERCHRCVLAVDPDHPRAHAELAAALYDQKQWNDAREHAKRAISLDSGLVRGQWMCAIVEAARGEWEDALAPAREWTVLSPREPLAWLFRGTIETRLGLSEESIQSFDAAGKHIQLVDHAINLSHLCQQSGHAEAGEVAARRGTEIAAANALAWSNLSACLSDLRRYAEAKRAAQKAVELDPALEPGWSNFLLSALEANDVETVSKALATLTARQDLSIKTLRLLHEHCHSPARTAREKRSHCRAFGFA